MTMMASLDDVCRHSIAIPAKAGIHREPTRLGSARDTLAGRHRDVARWIPAFAGITGVRWTGED
jgi:hypothetical protein